MYAFNRRLQRRRSSQGVARGSVKTVAGGGALPAQAGVGDGAGPARGRRGPGAGAARARQFASGPPGTRQRPARGQAAWVLPTLARRHLRSRAWEKLDWGRETGREGGSAICMMANAGNFDEL
jgi:hypothetical protein